MYVDLKDETTHKGKTMKPYKFNSFEIAESFVNRAGCTLMIMLGDDEKYWVVSPAQAAKLEKQGYEFAA